MEFRPSTPELAALFARCLPDDPTIVRRKMFGWPAAFVNERMFAGLHRESVVVRLADEDRLALLALEGARPFEPMPGREMTGYALVPDSMISDEAALQGWLRRAFEFVRTMPPKKK